MEEDIREEVTFVILKGKYLLDKRQGGFLDIVKTCLGPKMPLLFTKLYCGANDNGIGLQWMDWTLYPGALEMTFILREGSWKTLLCSAVLKTQKVCLQKAL